MKKKILYLTLLLAVGFTGTSCEDFLTSKDKDKVIPTKAKHFEELIYGELIYEELDPYSMTDVMADCISMEAVMGGTAEPQVGAFAFYTWQQQPEYNMEGDFQADRIYPALYANVMLCNSIESLLPGVTDDLKLVDRLYGEIYFLRALANYSLANLYGYPYVDYESSLTTPCVPLNELEGVDNVFLGRATQRAVYDKIEQDIERAVEHFTSAGYPETIYRPNLRAARVLATRIYLAEKKYDKVIEHANALDAEYGKLCNLTQMYKDNGNEQIYDIVGEKKKATFVNRRNTELLYTTGRYSAYPFYASFSYVPTHKLTTTQVIGLYEPNDLRPKIFFDYWKQPAKTGTVDGSVMNNVIRLSEALFNRAEAYLMTSEPELARADMQRVRRARFVDGNAPELSATGNQLEQLKNERMKEFCFEGHRWFDLRRWGCPKIEHIYVTVAGQKLIYTLNEGDVAYTLPLPQEEVNRNPVITNIPREKRVGVPMKIE